MRSGRQRNRNDCETVFYLGGVLGEQAAWARTAEVLIETVSCFDNAERKRYAEIADIQALTLPSVHQARQIKKREHEIASNRRMIITSWYNKAISYFSLSRKDDARGQPIRMLCAHRRQRSQDDQVERSLEQFDGTLFLAGHSGALDYVRKCDIDVGTHLMFWDEIGHAVGSD